MRRRASRETLVGVLGALGVPLEDASDAGEALRSRTDELRRRALEPVLVAWDGDASEIARGRRGRIELEDGDAVEVASAAGPVRLPPGYHRLETPDGEALVVAAPRRAPVPTGRSWGVFLPLYALRTGRDQGVGDLTDLERLLTWTAERGGSLVATLPLVATFTGFGREPFEPSPYAPASRLWWSEAYVDPARAPEWERSREARELVASPGFAEELARLRRDDLVEWRGVARAKRRVLELLAAAMSDRRRDDLDRFADEHRGVRDYARFRAATEERGPWSGWASTGDLPDLPAAHYHLYVQLLAHEQLRRLSEQAGGAGAGLYFDLPLGVHPASYDVWRFRDAFAEGASGGAPPDAFFSRGQSWGFPPLHPERIRTDGYRYPIACLRHLLRHADVLRIDHVMGLHRLWWVPDGMEAADGAYVRHRPEEWYAILSLEAHRAGAAIVGEDLGTVPPRVRAAMRRHGVLRSHVWQFAVSDDPVKPIAPPPELSLATLNTHDLPPFAAFWEATDVGFREELGLVAGEAAEAERAERARMRRAVTSFLLREGRLGAARPGSHKEVDARTALDLSLEDLAASDARVVIVNLEDCWGETRPQNVPGTHGGQHPNWRRKARHPFEAFCEMDGVTGRLEEVDRLRRGPER